MASPSFLKTIEQHIRATSARHNDLKLFRAADVPKRDAYTIEPHGHLAVLVVRWHPELRTISADEALAAKSRGPEAEDRIAASQWLRQVLTADGPRSAGDLIEEGAQRGFQARTLQRAFHAIGGHTEKRGLLEGWWWSLPAGTRNGSPPDPGKPVAFEETCRLRETSGLP